MSVKTSFLLHHDSLGILDKLDDEQAGKLFKAIYCCATNQTVDCDSLTDILLHPFQAQLSRDLKKWEAKAAISRTNGGKGGRPVKPSGLSKNPEEPSGLSKNPEEPSATQHNPQKPVSVKVSAKASASAKGSAKASEELAKEKNADELPHSLNLNAWEEFVLHRVQIRKSMKALAKTKAINILKVLTFEQQQNVVDYSIAGGYAGLFADKAFTAQSKDSGSARFPESYKNKTYVGTPEHEISWLNDSTEAEKGDAKH